MMVTVVAIVLAFNTLLFLVSAESAVSSSAALNFHSGKRLATEAEAKQVLSDYSPTGYFTFAFFTDSSCEQLAKGWANGDYSMEGDAVNVCIVRNDNEHSFMFRIVSDGDICTAYQQVFSDTACTVLTDTYYVGTNSPRQCFPYDYENYHLYTSRGCTTSSEPVVFAEKYILKKIYLYDESCQNMSYYLGTVIDECQSSERLTCSGNTQTETWYLYNVNQTCEGNPYLTQTVEIGTCVSNSIGSYHTSCSVLSNDVSADGGGGGGLSTGAITGITVGGFAFLSLCIAGVGFYLYGGASTAKAATNFEMVPSTAAPDQHADTASGAELEAGDSGAQVVVALD